MAVPPIDSGDRIPKSGNSLATYTGVSPILSSTVMTLPPGSGTRLTSTAPKACEYHEAAASASGTTTWGVTFIGSELACDPVLRVLVWNLFHGRSLPGAGRDLTDDFAACIRGWDWDLALLQEVPPWWPPELAGAAGAEECSALTSRNELLPLRRAVARRRPDLIESNGGGANAILSRVAVRDHRAVRLRRVPERRVMQLVRLEDGSCAANMHLSTVERLAERELRRAFALALDWAGEAPLIFGGDLNLRRPHLDGVTHVAARDVDHVFVRGFEPAGEARQLDRRFEGGRLLSDHVPLLVTLQRSA